ncbi:hypothetical protein C343_03331 [Cryptococcus neoformans C23]|uniref:FAS1 domain-containing protein n=3 Tax=Cryptococcus neoformans TaxID=5207 RepID=A0A854QH88_CRYNE|nr:hypothetical protein CNAG_00893 [Cryptococcus neoformans var. grubii H99]AUB25008.1 hypothetical protein CKF44_00893 [Cryptococcus neoformans var. grubii]OWZ31831.1 hypothetical protein C347_03394 [Cryptococcus neoformans var. grubii AD2-60a]OWZ43361.1 hypothetical protein C353_03234 [Cryptococcus neoformans var. grubii AD1-83a]OWZ43906.1 hypothetical protein C343_03331 [Cryptococcus neoformans var. grubii C23]OWZ54645.1 hypothetical protein C368_03287 [Cryptococcus neoformans var. grubii 1|eukprot:XP_012049177.1 hypothetical protein CNAG_00893 [Cryptococcus neoformans var. grubii H99]
MLGPKLRTIAAGFLLLATVGSSTFAMLQPEAYDRSSTSSSSVDSKKDHSQVSFTGDKVRGDGNAGGLRSEEGSLVDVILGSGGFRDDGVSVGGGATRGPTVADMLTTERTASLWWSYARDSVEIAKRLESKLKSSTVLVPIDKAILALEKKPHQSPGETPEDAAFKFISAHIIDGTPREGTLPTLLPNFSVEFVKDGSAKGGWRIRPGDVEVLAEKDGVNGRVMYLAEVLPFLD